MNTAYPPVHSRLCAISAVAALLLAGAAHAAVPTINLGQAANYSGFFYGNVSNVADVEGRLAVGGSLTTSGFSVGYRTPYGVTAPGVVVAGNVHLGDGAIYVGPSSNVNTNLTVGPTTGYATNPYGYGVYGGSNTGSAAYLDLNHVNQSTLAAYADFSATKASLTTLSSKLDAQAANGTVEFKSSSIYLTGDNHSDVQVFDVNTGDLQNLYLFNVKPSATVVINVTSANGIVTFEGDQGNTQYVHDQLEAMRGNVLFNMNGATAVNVNTFAYGTVLANSAAFSGTGHLEGNVIAASMDGKVEIGYEPFHAYTPATAVPEPETWAMLLAGLGLTAFAARRKRHA